METNIYYEYRTSRGVVAERFSRKTDADFWYQKKLEARPEYAKTLKLVKITVQTQEELV